MRIGASLLLIAIGAILKFAVTAHVDNVDIQAVGVILMIVGLVGLLFDLVLWGTRRRTTVVHTPGTPYGAPGTPYADPRYGGRTTYIEPRDPADLM